MPTHDPVLLRAVEGDPAARRVLVDRLGPLVWSLCRRLDPDPEDACQEVWEKVLRALSKFDPSGPAALSTWVATIAHRHLVDRHRRRVARGVVVDAEAEASPALAPRPEQARLEAALAGLPGEQRRVVVLHHVHGVPLEEIAAEEGVPLGTVKSRLHRARARLVEALGGIG